jgi:hypothetical protein
MKYIEVLKQVVQGQNILDKNDIRQLKVHIQVEKQEL